MHLYHFYNRYIFIRHNLVCHQFVGVGNLKKVFREKYARNYATTPTLSTTQLTKKTASFKILLFFLLLRKQESKKDIKKTRSRQRKQPRKIIKKK